MFIIFLSVVVNQSYGVLWVIYAVIIHIMSSTVMVRLGHFVIRTGQLFELTGPT